VGEVRGAPFRFGQIVDGPHFADRQAEAKALAADIQHGLNVVLISPRRFGKTSLVLRVIDDVRRAGVLVAYLDLQRTPTRERLADHLASAIYGGLVSPLDRARQQAARLFEHLPLRPKVTLQPDGAVTFEFGAGAGASAPDTDATLEQLLAMLGPLAQERERRVALVLDEFQEIVDLDPKLPAVMRGVFQAQADVAHVFLGSRQHLLRRVFSDRGEPLYRLAKPMPLGPIAAHEFVPFIRERFAAGRSQISAEAAEHLVAATEGHPNDTQELGHFAWALAVADGKPATRGTIDRALQEVVSAEAARFVDIWQGLTPPQRAVLLAVASEEGQGLYRETVRQRHGLGPAARVQKALQRLVDRELIEALSSGGYRVADVFFRAWLRQ
jgi:uncharacterized protein